MTQLDIEGGETPAAVPLTARQRIAWLHVHHHGPVHADEVGALLHEDARARGLRGHRSDERCEWCGSDGRQMLAALRLKGLVKERRGLGWINPAFPPAAPVERKRSQGDLPEGF